MDKMAVVNEQVMSDGDWREIWINMMLYIIFSPFVAIKGCLIDSINHVNGFCCHFDTQSDIRKRCTDPYYHAQQSENQVFDFLHCICFFAEVFLSRFNLKCQFSSHQLSRNYQFNYTTLYSQHYSSQYSSVNIDTLYIWY